MSEQEHRIIDCADKDWRYINTLPDRGTRELYMVRWAWKYGEALLTLLTNDNREPENR